MRRSWLYLILGFIPGLAIGAFAMLLVYPFLFPPAEVNETISDADQKQIVALGMFTHADPSDRLHWGQGGLEIYKSEEHYEILLKEDFEVGPGPDYRVYLSSATDIRSNQDFEQAENHEIAQLKSFKGSQVYRIDKQTLADKYQSLVIWCKTFGQLISPAELTRKAL